MQLKPQITKKATCQKGSWYDARSFIIAGKILKSAIVGNDEIKYNFVILEKKAGGKYA